MKKNFKHYKQALSAVLISMMVLQPISSLPSAWATEYDPEAVFDIEDEDSWFYEEEDDENIYSRATISTNSNAGKWGVTGFTLSAEGTAEAGKSYTITGTITAAAPASSSNAGWTSWASASNASGPEDALSKAKISVNSNGLFANDSNLKKTLSGSGYTSLTITGTTAAELTKSQYTVTVTMFGVDEMVTVTAKATSPEDPKDPEESKVTGSFDPSSLVLLPGEEGKSTLTVKSTTASPSNADIVKAITYKSSNGNVAAVSGNGTNVAVITAKELAEGSSSAAATISAVYGGKEIASLKVEVKKETEEEIKVESAEVNTDGAKPDYGNAPDEAKDTMKAGYNSAVKDIAGNKAVSEKAPDLKPGSRGWGFYGVPAGGIVYPVQTLGTVNMGYYQKADGTYQTFVEKVHFDIDLYWKSPDSDDAAKLENVKDGSFTFRIPVPSNIREGMNYAKVTHKGEVMKDYPVIHKTGNGWFIEVTVTHFSPFELEFVANKPSGSLPGGGGGSTGGGGGGGGSRSVSSSIPNLSGQWVLDANQRWWFSLTGGGYPANTWGRINNKWYYFDASGYMMIGWLKLADTWYFLQPSGDMVENDWVLYNNQWYFLEANGAMAANKWISYKNNWYYFNANGDMAVSTITPDGYMVDANGIWIQ